MAYNGDNRRVVKQQGTDITKFVWDSVIDAYVKELDGSNVVIATYTNEPQPYGAILSQRRGAATSILHADALGTTRLLTDSTQTVIDTYLYDAWGNVITSSGTTVNPFRWVGRYGYYMDQSTGMVYVRARMYVPNVAFYTSQWALNDYALDEDLVVDPRSRIWTCASARKRLEELSAFWRARGKSLSADLLDLFLGGKGNEDVEVDMSKYCHLMTSDPEYRRELKSYHRSHLPFNWCSVLRRQLPITINVPDVIPEKKTLKPNAFEFEWLTPIRSLRDASDDVLQDLKDIHYAVGSARIGHTGVKIHAYEKYRNHGCVCCVSTLTGNLILKDYFAFPNLLERKLISTDYSAGSFLQHFCGVKRLFWSMTCSDSDTITECDVLTVL